MKRLRFPSLTASRHEVTRRKPLRWLFGTLAFFALLAVVIINGFLVWVATGPRTLTSVMPYVEQELAAFQQDYTIKIGDSLLLWDGWRRPVDLRLKNVDVYTKEGTLFASFPEVSLGINVFALTFGHVVPDSVTIRKPVISLFQHADGHITFGTAIQTTDRETAPPQNNMSGGLIAQFLDPKSPLFRLKALTIEDASVTIGNEKEGVVFSAEHTTIELERQWDSVFANMSVSVPQGDTSGEASLQLNIPNTHEHVTGKLQFSRLMPAAFAPLLPSQPVIKGLSFSVNGWANITLDTNLQPLEARFYINAGEGTINTEYLDGSITLKQALLEGMLKGKNGLSIYKFNADINGKMLQGKADIVFAGEDTSIVADASIAQIPVDDIHHYWPLALAPESRNWVVTNISKGMLPSITLQTNIKPGDLKLPLLPEESILAKIAFEGAQVRYKPEHPELTQTTGVAIVSGKSLTVQVTKAHYMEDTRLSEGTVFIGDLNVDNPWIDVSFKAESSGSDVARFLSLPDMKHAQRLSITPDTLKGPASGSAKIGFPYMAPRDAKGNIIEDEMINYDVTATVNHVNLTGFLNRFDIMNAVGTMQVNNKEVVFDGSANVNDVSADAKVRYAYEAESGFNIFISANAPNVPARALKRFNYPDFPFINGVMGIKADYKQGDKAEQFSGTVDLSKASVSLPEYSWVKEAGSAARLTFTAEKTADTLDIPSFKIEGQAVSASGKATFGNSIEDVKLLKADPFKAGKNDLSLDYQAIPGGHKIYMRGASADFDAYINKPGEDTFSFKNFPALDMDVQVAQAYISSKHKISDLKAVIRCDKVLCQSANINGKVGDNAPFTATITQAKDKERSLDVKAKDAGAFLKALDVYDTMTGGVLTLQGFYDDTKSSHPLSGKLHISEHSIYGAPVLARMLTLASLTGFLDTLSGNGITFSKMNVPFTVENDVITLKDAKTSGPAIGINADGTIKFPGQHLDVKGTIVPAYTLNSALGNVPLIGDILVGGEGEGIFAARYTITGKSDNPDINVNPLSILTPGFLRGLFDVMDQPTGERPQDKPANQKGRAQDYPSQK